MTLKRMWLQNRRNYSFNLSGFLLQNGHFSVATYKNHFIVRSPFISYHQIHPLMTNLIKTSHIF